MNYNHLTIEERCCIRKYYRDGLSLRKIAEMVGRNVSTISREISAGTTLTHMMRPHIIRKYHDMCGKSVIKLIFTVLFGQIF